MMVGRDIPGRGPDRRYLRRRANRRVRKARRARAVARAALVVAANLVVAAILGYAAMRGVRTLTESSRFDLRGVRIEGVSRGSQSAIRARIAPALTRNLLDLDLGRIAALAEGDAWVRQATARRLLPGTLVVRVVERRPAAVAVIHGLAHLVDDGGVVIGPCGAGLDDDLPVLTGLEDLEGEDLADALRRGVSVLERIREADGPWHAEVSEVDIGRPDRLTARMRGSAVRVLLDPDRVVRNLGAYLDLRSAIDERVGPVDYVDLRWDRRISVMPLSTVENR